MYCTHCGKQADEFARFCPECGQSLQGNMNAVRTPPLHESIATHVFQPLFTNSADVPTEIRGWNWGAFGAGIFWTAAMGLWNWFAVIIVTIIFGVILQLFAALPLLATAVFLGIRGNELAWNSSRKWQSVDEFKTIQVKWRILGIVLFIAQTVLFVVLTIVVVVVWVLMNTRY